MRNVKTIFSLKIYLMLKRNGIEPILEKDNINQPGFKCWIYEITPEFKRLVDEYFEGGSGNG